MQFDLFKLLIYFLPAQSK